MAVPRAVSCVVMLEDNHAHNGALMVVPGSHMHFISCVGATPEANWETSLKAQQHIGVPSHQQIQVSFSRRGGGRGWEIPELTKSMPGCREAVCHGPWDSAGRQCAVCDR